MKPTIVKVQVPLASNQPIRGMEHGLVYAEGRKNMVEQLLPRDVTKALNGDFKGYFEAFWSSTVGWAIGKRVEEQPW